MADYLKVNVTNAEALNLIRNSILNKNPFSFVRYGDGHLFLIKKTGDSAFLKKNCNYLGYNYPSELSLFFDYCYPMLKDSFINSDLIGLMHEKNKEIYKNDFLNNWALEKKYISDWKYNPNLKICDFLISRSQELGNPFKLKDILQGNSVHIISPHSKILSTKGLDKIFKTKVSFTQLPNKINNRNEMIPTFKNIKENVIILGVGFQKDYGTILKTQYGKISLDLGATLDAWSGIMTRPWFKPGGSQEYCVIK